MNTIIILSITLCIMLLLPLAIAWIYHLTTEGVVMWIQQDKVRDQRYFAKSFSDKIVVALLEEKSSDHMITLSHKEHYIDYEELKSSDKRSVDELVVITGEDFISPGFITEYNKEIYIEENGMFNTPKLSLRCVYSGKRMYLGNGCEILRWIDAEDTLAVYDDCDLGMSASAGRRMSIGQNVRFRRLYAEMIYFGQYPDTLVDPMEGRDELAFRLPIIHKKEKIRHVTNEKLTSHGTAPYTIVNSGKTIIVEDAILQGDIHTNGSVRICKGAGVLGNIFAEGSILLEEGCFVAGNVFSQKKIEIDTGVMVGKKGKSISVIARGKITIRKDVVIYGYVSSEKGGVVCPLYDVDAPRHDQDYQILDYEDKPLDIEFKDLEDYEITDESAFRMDRSIRSVKIPKGARKIGRSMFCECKNMISLEFPGSIISISDFALYNCRKLKEISSFADTGLEELGVSAMENCSDVEKLEFPKSLKTIGAGACAGMTSLRSVTFADGCQLTEVQDHAFRDCINLKEIVIPDGVRHVGVSAFRDCNRLERISVPECIKDEEGISELSRILPKVEIEYRKLPDDKDRDK